MIRWSRGRLDVPSSVSEVAGWERRASIRLMEVEEDCMFCLSFDEDWVCVWVRLCVEGSAGGVRGPEGEAMLKRGRGFRCVIQGLRNIPGNRRSSGLGVWMTVASNFRLDLTEYRRQGLEYLWQTTVTASTNQIQSDLELMPRVWGRLTSEGGYFRKACDVEIQRLPFSTTWRPLRLLITSVLPT